MQHTSKHFNTLVGAGFFILFALACIGSSQNIAKAQSANMISNPDFETASPSSSGIPMDWVKGRWGTNTTAFSYSTVGENGSKAVAVTISDRTSGDAKWAFTPVSVIPGRTYTYSDIYKATVPTVITVEYTKSDGTRTYLDIGKPYESTSWKSESFAFTVPANVTKVTIFHLLNQVGTLEIDSTYLIETTPIPDENLVQNPSFEIMGQGGVPVNWLRGRWGVNGTAFIADRGPHTGTKAGRIEVDAYTSGDAKWYFPDIPTEGGKVYEFSDYYQSNTASVITIQFKKTNGTYSYVDIGSLPAMPGWTQFKRAFTVPSGVVSFTVFHLIKSVGFLTIDDVRVLPLASDPNKFDKGYVSLNFDDNWLSAYQNALPVMEAAGFHGDQFIVTGYMHEGYPGYSSAARVQDMQARGEEIGAHTKTHPDLTAISLSQAKDEIEGSRQELLSLGLTPVSFFAYPLGAYNDQVKQLVKEAGFLAARSTNSGYNDKTTDLYALKRQSMTSTTTFAEVKNYIDTAIADKTWVILLFHEVNDNGNQYAVTPALFQQIVDYMKQKGVTPITIGQGVNLMTH